MKRNSCSGRRSTALVAVSVALALSNFASEPITNRLERLRLPPEHARKGAELLMRSTSTLESSASGTVPSDRMDAQRGHRPAPPLIKPTPRYGFGDRGQSFDPVLGRPPGLILFSLSF